MPKKQRNGNRKRMDSKNIDKLIEKRVSWLADSGPDDDIAISTRIRLARNLKDTPFPICASETDMQKTVLAVQFAAEKSPALKNPISLEMQKLDDLDRAILFERRLVSLDFSIRPKISSLILNEDEDLSVMVNEEDHIRMQAIHPGFKLNKVWKAIDEFDNSISNQLPFAFDPVLGFLTSCPTNVGTGMRASVMLHLPALALANQVQPLIQGVNKLGLAVRGIFGEGTDNLGNLCQISNQSTLGESEVDIIKRLEMVITQIINHEKNARAKLLETNRDFLLDNIGRAYGALKYAYVISSKEALNSLSMLRLGVDMGVIRTVDIHTVNELFIHVQPAHLQKYAGKELSQKERDRIRATLIRNKLKSGSKQ